MFKLSTKAVKVEVNLWPVVYLICWLIERVLS